MSAKAKKNRGLGRGLDALFAEQAPIMPDNRYFAHFWLHLMFHR